MVDDLNLPIQILTVPTVREPDGLAMSSRNAYLDETERQSAPVLHECLRGIEKQLIEGSRDFAALEQSAAELLAAAGFTPEYVAIRSADDLADPGPDCVRFVVLAAAHLGQARLIDNLVVDV
jgi:pantoate--beta-alanine ligase